MRNDATEVGNAPLIELRSLRKSFGGFRAVQDVSLVVGRGETVGLLGDNGAGKSTVIKLLAGVHRPDGGQIIFGGEEIVMTSPKRARQLGIETVYQNLALVDELTVARNFYLGAELKKRIGPFKLLDERGMVRSTEEYLQDIGISRVRGRQFVQFLSGGERQAIAIARAMYFGARVLVLDEPTSALSVKETRKVLEYIRVANERRLGVIVVSHNIRHVVSVAHRVVVVHHGRSIADISKDKMDEEVIEELITTGKTGPVTET